MLTNRTLSRIASAQFDAERMSLPQTAGRLGALRRELDRFIELTPESREKKKAWALAKLEDTERTFRSEIRNIPKEDVRHIEFMRAIAKTVGTIANLAIVLGLMDFVRKSAGGPMSDLPLAFAGAIALVAATSILLTKFVGGTLEGAAKNIEKAIGDCRNTLTRG